MMNTYKIYIGEKSFFITNELDSELKSLVSTDSAVLLYNPDRRLLKEGLNKLESTAIQMVIALTNNTDKTFEIYKSLLMFIEAGGGLVKNDIDEYLFIFRHGRWDLPKGKLDAGESISECALREVGEETGLKNIILEIFLLYTWHIYKQNDKYILKQTSWYEMNCPAGQDLKLQKEEGIQDAVWLKKEDWPKILQNTFPSVKDVLDTV